MEILGIDLYMNQPGFVAGAATVQTVALTTNPNPSDDSSLGNNTGAGLFIDPRTIKQWTRTTFSNASPASFFELENIRHFDLTDSAGHGILIATDQLFLLMTSNGTLALNTGGCKLDYRFKNVALEEYIGIVQSQQ